MIESVPAVTEALLDVHGGNTQFSTREVPWMKLGKLIEKPVTAAEAAELGGLNFTVEKRPIWFGDDEDINSAIPTTRIHDRVAIVRTDTGKPLSIVAKDYRILQYAEAFDFMDQISPQYVAAGALKGGKQGFMVVRAPETIKVLNNEDPHELFLVLRTSHDCTRAVEISVMPLRYKCMNQLTLRSFNSKVPHRWAVKHTTTMQAKLAEAKAALAKLGAYAQEFERNAERLVNVKLTDGQAQEILERVLPDRPKRKEQIHKIITSWHTAPTVGFDYTGWGLVSAVSEYFDWGRSSGTPESRFIGALQGQTHNAINRTATLILSRAPKMLATTAS